MIFLYLYILGMLLSAYPIAKYVIPVMNGDDVSDITIGSATGGLGLSIGWPVIALVSFFVSYGDVKIKDLSPFKSSLPPVETYKNAVKISLDTSYASVELLNDQIRRARDFEVVDRDYVIANLVEVVTKLNNRINELEMKGKKNVRRK